jgi:hypothetical protein
VHEEWGALMTSFKRLISGIFGALRTHTKKVERGRYCACCGALAGYYVTTAFCGMTHEEMVVCGEGVSERSALIIKGAPSAYLCREHHPNLGSKRFETRKKMLTHPKLDFDLITPNPFL